MIVLVAADDPRLQPTVLAGHPLLVTAIAGRAACPQPEMDWWVLPREDGTAAAALCRNGSTFYLTGEPCCAGELADFLQTVGWERAITDLPLPLSNPQPMLGLVWQEAVPILPELAKDDRLVYLTRQSSRLSAVAFAQFQQQCGVFESDDETERYAVSLSHAVRRGQAGVAAILRGGEIIAGCAVNHAAGGHAILGAVATSPQLRRQGLATAVITAGVCLSFAMGYRPYLCCREALRPLYLGAGFSLLDPLMQYRKEL